MCHYRVHFYFTFSNPFIHSFVILHIILFCLVKESAGSETRDNVVIDPSEEHELPSGHGTANCLIRFEGGKTMHSLNFEGEPTLYNPKKDGFQTIRTFECRGVEPVSFDARGGFIIKLNDGRTTYDDIEADLSDLPFEFYHEESETLVTIDSATFQFVKIASKK